MQAGDFSAGGSGGPGSTAAAGPRPRSAPHLWVALLGIFAAHSVTHTLRGTPLELLWICNLALPTMAAGVALGWPRVVGVAFLWLAGGTVLWGIDLAFGGDLLATSLLTHLGGMAIGWLAMRRAPPAAGLWWRASLGAAGVLLTSRLLLPAEGNINLAFEVDPSVAELVPHYWAYVALVLGANTLGFYLIERPLLRGLRGPTAP